MFDRCCLTGDEISGLSVSIRERDNLFQIWNTNSELHEKSTVIQKVKELLASIQFLTVFYTGKCAEIILFVQKSFCSCRNRSPAITCRLAMLMIIVVIIALVVV